MPDSKVKVTKEWPTSYENKVTVSEGEVLHEHGQNVHDHVKHVHEDHVYHVHAPEERVIEHVDHVQHIDHVEHIDHIFTEEQATIIQSDFIGELAHVFALTALLLYAYTLIGCYIFRPSFIRQLAYILQTIRLALTLATLLPCVLHWQAFQMFPVIPMQIFPYVILALLVLNIIAAIGLRNALAFFWERYQRYNNSCVCRSPGKPFCGLLACLQTGESRHSKKKCHQ